jgi:DnaJ-class molecular chaperone
MADAGPVICPACNGRGYAIVRLGVSTPLSREECWICQGNGWIEWPPEEATPCPTPKSGPKSESPSSEPS